MAKEVTKAELLQAIAKKVQRAKPMVKYTFLKGLQYKTKSELKRILKKAKVDKDGWGIDLR